MKQFPFVCQCGFNTMSAARARAHADTHALESMRAACAREITHARGRAVYLCPIGYDSESGTSGYNTHGRAFYVSSSELSDARGIVLCEFCECECVRLDV